MAKNKNNSFRNSNTDNARNTNSNTSKNASDSSNRSQNGSMKDTHAQVPDKGPSRSGPGGQ